MTTRLELLPDVYLTAVQTSRFKTACFSLSFLLPERPEEAGMNALLRGSESAPSIRAIARMEGALSLPRSSAFMPASSGRSGRRKLRLKQAVLKRLVCTAVR